MSGMLQIPAPEGVCLVKAGEGQTFDLDMVHFNWKVRREDSSFQYTVFEACFAQEEGVDLHSHPSPETFYVLEGNMTFYYFKDGHLQETVLGTGETITLVPNALHALFNRETQNARLLNVATVAHQEFFDAMMKANAQRAFAAMPKDEARALIQSIAAKSEMFLAPIRVADLLRK